MWFFYDNLRSHFGSRASVRPLPRRLLAMQESLAEARRKLRSVEHEYHERKLTFAQQKTDLVLQYKYDRTLLKRGMSNLESLIQEMEVDAAEAGHEGAEPPDEGSEVECYVPEAW